MIIITKPLPAIPTLPFDQVKAGQNAARIFRQRAETNTLMEGDFERFMAKIDAGFAAALVVAASAPAPERPFRVIDGGRS